MALDLALTIPIAAAPSTNHQSLFYCTFDTLCIRIPEIPVNSSGDPDKSVCICSLAQMYTVTVTVPINATSVQQTQVVYCNDLEQFSLIQTLCTHPDHSIQLYNRSAIDTRYYPEMCAYIVPTSLSVSNDSISNCSNCTSMHLCNAGMAERNSYLPRVPLAPRTIRVDCMTASFVQTIIRS
jgi:hypothetical protein